MKTLICIFILSVCSFAQVTLPTWFGVTGEYVQGINQKWNYGVVFATPAKGALYSITQVNLSLQESIDPTTNLYFYGLRPTLSSDLAYSILPNKISKFQLLVGGGLIFGTGTGLPLSIAITPLFSTGKWAFAFTLRGLATPTLQSVTSPIVATPFKPVGQLTILYHIGN